MKSKTIYKPSTANRIGESVDRWIGGSVDQWISGSVEAPSESLAEDSEGLE